jgi:hypothetical protein
MFGVAHVYVCYGYEGWASKTVRTWWNGTDWQSDPVDSGPFLTQDEAQLFVDSQPRYTC